MADALLESRGVTESVHVENSETDCAPHHDDRYCQIIRSLSGQRGAAAAAFVLRSGPEVEAELSARPSDFVPGLRSVGSIGPRAPPVG